MFKSIINCSVIVGLLFNSMGLGCEKPVQALKEGQKSPCTGYLFSPEKEKEVRITVQETELKEAEIELQKQKIKLLKENEQYFKDIASKEAEKAELWRNRAEESTKKLVEKQEDNETRDWFLIATGILVTVAAGFAVGQASN